MENLRSDLDREPADDRISDSDLVNVASLQLGKEVVDPHLFSPVTHKSESAA